VRRAADAHPVRTTLLRRKAATLGVGAFPLFASGDVLAHVKWFAPFDLEQPPAPVGEVLTPQFVYLYITSILCIYAFFWIDRYLYRRRFLGELAERIRLSPTNALRILRAAVCVFFVALFVYGIKGTAFLLTPELKTEAGFVPWLQLGLAACAVLPATTPLTGVGILVLYAMGVVDYGLFHMLDYFIFLGVAVYLLLSRLRHDTVMRARFVTLYATTGLTLLWASVEKWGYAEWTYPLLERDPSLLMGLTPYFYMLLAGFVEFNVTFTLLSSVSTLARVIAFGLNVIFVLAIYKFGLVDAVGHLLIITILVIFVLRGQTRAREFLVLGDKSLWSEAYFMTGLYVLALNVIALAWYGIYHLSYG